LEYPIETVDLVKRYPTSAKRIGVHTHMGGQVTSFGSVFTAFRKTKGPFIEALRGVSLKIKKGEIFGVLGPNGAGKTTLIKILCTLVIHDEGEAYVQGFDVRKEPVKVLKNLQAVLPESRGFNWRLSGRQNLEFFALLYGLKEEEAKERIDYLLEFTGLKERANDGYQRYSTGMQRKLLLCRALLQNTPILLFDEPTAGLDPVAAIEFRDLLHNRLAQEEGKTMLLSTHNLYEAKDMCDRIAILDRGKITACDTPDNIRQTIFDEKVFNIAFTNAVFNDNGKEMVNGLEEMPGVHGVTPQIGQGGDFNGISIRVNKDMDLSDILEVIRKRGLKIRTINTEEPTLEDAFMAITGQNKEQRTWELKTETKR
jgi:ABC-2 type transport system ATP-binding protein